MSWPGFAGFQSLEDAPFALAVVDSLGVWLLGSGSAGSAVCGGEDSTVEGVAVGGEESLVFLSRLKEVMSFRAGREAFTAGLSLAVGATSDEASTGFGSLDDPFSEGFSGLRSLADAAFSCAISMESRCGKGGTSSDGFSASGTTSGSTPH